ncbi:MAG: zinc ribbon domain-containing protein [Planctomycetota bacterium]|jgi:putative FmdB family regulatory protein
MPIYEYKCENGHKFEDIKSLSEYGLPTTCPKCHAIAERIPSRFFCLTDTNFFYTGRYDSRLGSRVEGRKDFWDKAKKKGLHEIPTKDFAVTTTMEDRIKNMPDSTKIKLEKK